MDEMQKVVHDVYDISFDDQQEGLDKSGDFGVQNEVEAKQQNG